MKRKISKNLLSFIILAASLLVAHLVFAQDLGTNAVSNGLAGSLGTTDPRTIAGRIINIVLGFLGVVAVGLISYAGFVWMTAGGNEEKIETAKKILKNGVIGLVIILSSWAIATFIINQLLSATGNSSGGGCSEGDVISCGCNNSGSMICSGGSYGSCIGSNCTNGGGNNPTNCDSSSNPGCQAVDQICSSGDYCDHNDCGCKPQGGLGDSCNSDVSGATCQADNNRCGQYLSCNPATCTCYGSPVITAISPTGGYCQENVNKSCAKDIDCTTTCNLSAPNGAVNNFLTISGKNFGTYAATSSKVIFEGGGVEGRQPTALNPTCVSTWQDNQIVIAVPSGATAGAIKVENRDNLSDNTSNDYGPKIPDFQSNNISRPGLCYLDPNVGILSSEVGYKGINLYSGNAYFGNYQNNVSGLNSKFVDAAGLIGTSTTPNIQSGNSGSFVSTTLNGHLEKSNYLLFTKASEPGEGPFISSFAPASGNSGQYVTIRGNGFGGARGASHVYFGTTEAAYDFPDMCLNSVWKNDQIIVKVPAGLANGDEMISLTIGATTINTQKLNPNTFHADKNLDLSPSLCKIDPAQGPVATPVALWGEYFGKVNDVGRVEFNHDKSATGTITADGRAHKITTAVPAESITGPVKVFNNSLSGNELNFTVGECSQDSDCGTQICCPQDTYKKGRCANTLAECFIDIPTSVFEWSFSTGFGASTPNPFAYSCSGLAKYSGSCQAGATCPNVPGSCSSYAGGGKKTVADCDLTCFSVPGCNNLSPNDCFYDSSSNRCVKNGTGANCDLNKTLEYTVGAATSSTLQICNQDGHWEANIASSCPSGWTKVVGNKCVDLSSNCSICSADFSCADVSGTGRCVSQKICPIGSTCENNTVISEKDRCVVLDQPTCDCCCQIGSDARDCCAPLTCQGTCGSDTGKTTGATLGKCGGCKSAGTTPETRDAACNCSGHSGQFCDINNSDFSAGVCVDCSGLSGQDCFDHSSACCLDSNKTTTTTDDICRGGNGKLVSSVPASPNYGYCAYYDCSVADPTQCASTTPVKGDISGITSYNSTSTCAANCAEAGLCSGITDLASCQAHSRCCFDSKNTADQADDVCHLGEKIIVGADNGYCAYFNCSAADPAQCASTTPIKTGAYGSLDDCNNICAARPEIASTSPAHLANNVCRNATVKVSFNIALDVASLSDNILLLEEHDYGSGVCPSGTFVARGNSLEGILAAKNSGWLARLSFFLKSSLSRLSGNFSQSANANVPDPNKLYCAVPGMISGDNNSAYPYFTFAPQSLLSPATNYYLVIKGDEGLNNKTGILSDKELGFNGKGYFDPTTTQYVPGVSIKFNNRNYKNSQIIKFTTLTDQKNQASPAGICAIDQVKVSPTSYLFKTTENALNEKDDDANASNKTFDTVADRDKVFTAQAYNTDGYLLQPTTGYFWDWNFQVSDPSIARIISPVTGLDANKALVAAVSGVTDSETKITATINMNRFNPLLPASTCVSGNCSCAEPLCSNNCCNAYSGGDKFNQSSPIYVFVCNNPWPPVDTTSGTWSPWVDNCQGAVSGASWIGSPCDSYNYKFYYCRDAGAVGTLDDLPAIMNQAVVRGLSSNFICSADRSTCDPSINSGKCGLDKNGDGTPDGFCAWNVLKESYFFREDILSGGEITAAADLKTGGAVKIDWRSEANPGGSYKIYYLKSGKGTMYSKEVRTTDACTLSGTINNCSAIISGLSNKVPYVFKVSVISVNKTESALSTEKTATPTDSTPPVAPGILIADTISSSTMEFSWTANTDDAVVYRLYHGVQSGLYGESFDSAQAATSLTLATSLFPPAANNYFALAAVDASGNESAKSAAWSKALNAAETPIGQACAVKLNVNGSNNVLCTDAGLTSTAQWFKGTIVNSGAAIFCSVPGCTVAHNPNKCRYYDDSWAFHCYVSKSLP